MNAKLHRMIAFFMLGFTVSVLLSVMVRAILTSFGLWPVLYCAAGIWWTLFMGAGLVRGFECPDETFK